MSIIKPNDSKVHIVFLWDMNHLSTVKCLAFVTTKCFTTSGFISAIIFSQKTNIYPPKSILSPSETCIIFYNPQRKEPAPDTEEK